MTEKQKEESITVEDLDWCSYLMRQAQICRAEAQALEQVALSKLQVKYKIDSRFGESIDFETGKIVRKKTNVSIEETK